MSESRIFAVCDLEVDYAYNFMEYLNRKRTLPFEIQAFTSAEILCRFAKARPVEILLISDKAMTPQIEELNIRKIIILSEGVHRPELDQYPSIYKYQASDQVVREVMDCYSAEQITEKQTVSKRKKTKVYGIYSPVGRTRKTSFAITLGQILAKEEAVLYLNLENYAGFEQILGESFERTIGDLIYYIRQENTNPVCKLGGMVRTIQNLDFVPPAISPADIQNTSSEEWVRLISEIRLNSRYEVLILDLGDSVADIFSVLKECDRIYMPVRQDFLSEAKVRQFEDLLKFWDSDDLQSRLVKLTLPYHQVRESGRGYFEGLIWSELGDYVRKLLRNEKEIVCNET